MAVNVNENGSIKDLGVRSNLDWNGIEYIGQRSCWSSEYGHPYPVFDLPRPLSDYKYMILFGHMNDTSTTPLYGGTIIFSPADVYTTDYKRIVVSFINNPKNTLTHIITITDLTASSLTTFNQGGSGSYQRLYGIY